MRFLEGTDPSDRLDLIGIAILRVLIIIVGIATINLTCNERPIPATILDSCRKAKIFYEKKSGLLIQCYEIAPDVEKK